MKKIIAANWKMNFTTSQAIAFLTEILPELKETENEVILCVPYVFLESIKQLLEKTTVHLGAQNMHEEDFGAFTGEISAPMLKELGVSYVILGHSERREYFNDHLESIHKKVKQALNYGINIILCVGESLEEREKGKTKEKISLQLDHALQGVTKDEMKNIIIAYEPIWAIGTGKTASNDQAQEMCAFIKDLLFTHFHVNSIAVLYGGSVNKQNASALFSMPSIDGALVGGASLTKDFIKIVNA